MSHRNQNIHDEVRIKWDKFHPSQVERVDILDSNKAYVLYWAV